MPPTMNDAKKARKEMGLGSIESLNIQPDFARTAEASPPMANPNRRSRMQSNKPWTHFDYFFGVMQMAFIFSFVGPILAGLIMCMNYYRFPNLFAVWGACVMGIPPFIIAGFLSACGVILLYRYFPLAPKRLVAFGLGAIITPLLWIPTLGIWSGKGVIEVWASTPDKFAGHSIFAAVLSGGICAVLGWSFLVEPKRA